VPPETHYRHGCTCTCSTTYFNRNGNEPRFFCDDGLDALWRVDWMVLLSDNYFVLGLFLVSRIERVLPRMFPCHDAAFHLLGRYLLHPRNVVPCLVHGLH
jgi:xyloglucan fucosyltransferase